MSPYTTVSPPSKKNLLEKRTQYLPTAVTEPTHVGLYRVKLEYPKELYALLDSTLRDSAYIRSVDLWMFLMNLDITEESLLLKVIALPPKHTSVEVLSITTLYSFSSFVRFLGMNAWGLILHKAIMVGHNNLKSQTNTFSWFLLMGSVTRSPVYDCGAMQELHSTA